MVDKGVNMVPIPFQSHSMYLKNQLDRFIDQITDELKAVKFRRVCSTINFDQDGLCGGAALDVFNNTDVDHLRREFEQRHIEFLNQADLNKIRG